MTRTDVMASSRPRTAGAGTGRRGSRAWRGLIVLPVVLLMALALFSPASALAAEETSGYSQTPTTPKTTSTSKEAPSKTSSTPTATSEPAKEAAKTLPFTGLDLRWVFGIGLLMVAAGFGIVVVQRRRAGDSQSR
jgi:predicted metalloprotease